MNFVGMGGEMKDLVRLLRAPTLPSAGLPAGDGRPVVLVPGLTATDRSLRVLGRGLRDLGYAPERAAIGINVRCGEEAATGLLARVEEVADRHGAPVALVGHSRGGHLARIAAIRRPDLVSGIVTLGTPKHSLSAVSPAGRALALSVGAVGSAGVPGVYKLSCFDRGGCCRRYREELEAPLPEGVGFVGVWSRRDALVRWRKIDERDAELVEVSATHIGMATEPEVFAAVAHALSDFARDGDAVRRGSKTVGRRVAA